MILIAVIVGYLLGISPFVVMKILEQKEKQIGLKENEKQYKEQEAILDEWLNGANKNSNKESDKINQEDIFKEYMTGITSPKGE